MIYSFLLSTLTLLLLTGCSSTHVVRTADDVRTVNQHGSDSRAHLLVAGGARHAGAWDGDAVTVVGDSVLWIDADNGTIRSAHITEVESIRFTDHGAGLWQGIGVGALAGVGVGLLGSAMAGSSTPPNAGLGTILLREYSNSLSGIAAFTFGFSGTLAFGGLIGTAVGSRTYYTFPDTTLFRRDSISRSASAPAR